jgi:uncharacterized protein (TIGR02145 family)
MPAEARVAWLSWAAYLPQRTLRSAFVFLTGYQNFVKRNFYALEASLNPSHLMHFPLLVTYAEDHLTSRVTRSDANLFLNVNFENNDSNLRCSIYVSTSLSFGLNFGNTHWRLMCQVPNSNDKIDITESFIKYFGILPSIDDKIFVSSIFYGKDNGQFWSHTLESVIVEPDVIPIYPTLFGGLFHRLCRSALSPIYPDGWIIPSAADFNNLVSFLGGSSIAGGKMKEIGLVYWKSPNRGATNEAAFNGRGAGVFSSVAPLFQAFMQQVHFMSSNFDGAPNLLYLALLNNSTIAFLGQNSYHTSLSCRFRKISTSLSEGQTGTMIGNDGKVYPTIVIAGIEWMAANSCETKFRDGSLIPLSATAEAFNASSIPCRIAPNLDNTLVPW